MPQYILAKSKACRFRSWNWTRCQCMGWASAVRLTISQTSVFPSWWKLGIGADAI